MFFFTFFCNRVLAEIYSFDIIVKKSLSNVGTWKAFLYFFMNKYYMIFYFKAGIKSNDLKLFSYTQIIVSLITIIMSAERDGYILLKTCK